MMEFNRKVLHPNRKNVKTVLQDGGDPYSKSMSTLQDKQSQETNMTRVSGKALLHCTMTE